MEETTPSHLVGTVLAVGDGSTASNGIHHRLTEVNFVASGTFRWRE